MKTVSPIRYEAAYDPADNKIRLRASARLPKEVYDRVRAAGFIWAPKQELFVAPMWTPEREDLAIELAGEIGDEDTSLVERAEERAERFEDYGEKRAAEAESAHEAVNRIADGIPLGQPILVGHHSERRARKDAEKIRSGMTRAVKLWETSEYWEQRAKGAIRAAKYRELPGVRHRRIKGLEADLRKFQKERTESLEWKRLWGREGLTREQALALANHDWSGHWSALDRGTISLLGAAKDAIAGHLRKVERAERWISHITNRLTYERAMLDEGGGIAVQQKGFDVQPGGQVLARGRWGVVLRVNRTGGVVSSYTIAGRHGREVQGIEHVEDYRAPGPEDAAKVKAATKLPPLVNYPGDGFRHMTQVEWDKIARWNEFSKAHRIAATETTGAHRLRMAPREGRPYYDTTGVWITDAPRRDPPGPPGAPAVLPARLLAPERATRSRAAPAPARAKIDALKGALKAGVQVVVADQLFPTPRDLAARMVELAGVQRGQRVLEPSAGTGNIVFAIEAAGGEAFPVEIDPLLAGAVKAKCCDFLELVPGTQFGPAMVDGFDAVIMNPPFSRGQDVRHVMHALKFLRAGGVLVGICGGGPRQEEALRAMSSRWEDLPPGTFQGTNVRANLFVIRGLMPGRALVSPPSASAASSGDGEEARAERDTDRRGPEARGPEARGSGARDRGRLLGPRWRGEASLVEVDRAIEG